MGDRANIDMLREEALADMEHAYQKADCGLTDACSPMYAALTEVEGSAWFEAAIRAAREEERARCKIAALTVERPEEDYSRLTVSHTVGRDHYLFARGWNMACETIAGAIAVMSAPDLQKMQIAPSERAGDRDSPD